MDFSPIDKLFSVGMRKICTRAKNEYEAPYTKNGTHVITATRPNYTFSTNTTHMKVVGSWFNDNEERIIKIKLPLFNWRLKRAGYSIEKSLRKRLV
jgi:hypothetical protein